MRSLAAFLFAMMIGVSSVRAELPAECAVAQALVGPDFGLPRVAQAIEKKKLNVLVIGAGSSTLPGAAAKAYPARLQASLAGRLPGVNVTVQTDVRLGRSAIDAAKAIPAALGASHPALIVWQAGTIDAMKAVDLDEFSAALDTGVDAAHAAGSDIILLNAQYSPRTESMIGLNQYADNMRWVALRHDIPLFDRYAIMKLWAELGTFDFMTHTKKLDMAEHVHDCIGRLLADLVISSSKEAPPNGVR
jgi:hypothetical protein